MSYSVPRYGDTRSFNGMDHCLLACPSSCPYEPSRPPLDKDLRDLIRRMAQENPLWGASHILSELRLLDYEVA